MSTITLDVTQAAVLNVWFYLKGLHAQHLSFDVGLGKWINLLLTIRARMHSDGSFREVN